MLVSEVRRMSKIKRGILFIVILAVFLVTSSVGMEYYEVHQLNGEVIRQALEHSKDAANLISEECNCHEHHHHHEEGHSCGVSYIGSAGGR